MEEGKEVEYCKNEDMNGLCCRYKKVACRDIEGNPRCSDFNGSGIYGNEDREQKVNN